MNLYDLAGTSYEVPATYAYTSYRVIVCNNFITTFKTLHKFYPYHNIGHSLGLASRISSP